MASGNVNVGALIASLGIDIKEFEQGLKEAKESMEEAENSMKNSMEEVGRKMQKVGRSMANVGKKLSVAVTLPLIAAGTAAVKAEMEFESLMTKMVSLVGISRRQVTAWRDDLLDMTTAVGKSPRELADAMYFITSAGMRGAQALDVLKQSAKVSAAGVGEVKLVADLTTSAINAFGKENMDASHALDVLVSAIRLGKVEAEDLATSMGHVLPVASKLKVSFEDMAAGIAALTRTGTPAETAAVQIRQLLSQLMGPSEQAKDAFREINLSARELRETLVNEGLFEALEKFDKGIRDFGDIEMAKDIFGNIRALTGVFDLMGENMEYNRELFEDMRDNVGAADRAFEIASKTLKFKWNQALAAFNNSLVEIGNSMKKIVIPLLEDLMEWLKKTTQWFSNLTVEEQKSILKKLALTAAIGPLLSLLGNLTIVLGGIVITIGKMGVVLKAAAAAWRAFTVAVASNPIGAIAVVLSGAAAALASHIIKLKQAREAAREAAAAHRELGQSLDNVSAKMGEQVYQSLFDTQGGIDIAKNFDKFKESLGDMSLDELKAVQMYLEDTFPKAVRDLMTIDKNKTPLLFEVASNDLDIVREQLNLIKKEVKATEAYIELQNGKYAETQNLLKRLKNQASMFADTMEQMGKAHKQGLLEGEFDAAAEELKWYQSQLEEYLSGKGATLKDPIGQYFAENIKRLGGVVEDTGKSFGVLENDIGAAFRRINKEAQAAMTGIGEEVDVPKEKMRVLEKFLDKVLDGDYKGNVARMLERLGIIASELKEDLPSLEETVWKELRESADKNKKFTDSIIDLGRLDLIKMKLKDVEDQIRNVSDAEGDHEALLAGLSDEYLRLTKQQAILNATGKKNVWDSLKDDISETEILMQSLKSAVTSVTDAFGKMFDKEHSGWTALVSATLSSIKQIIDALFAKAVAALIAGEITAYGIIGLATAAVGVSALSSLWNSHLQRESQVELASGGMAYGPTTATIGEYPGARANPEVIAPLDRLKSILRSNGDGQWETASIDIPGDKLRILLEKNKRKRNIMA